MYFPWVLTILLHTLQLLVCHVQRSLVMNCIPRSAWLWSRTFLTSLLPHPALPWPLCMGSTPFTSCPHSLDRAPICVPLRNHLSFLLPLVHFSPDYWEQETSSRTSGGHREVGWDSDVVINSTIGGLPGPATQSTWLNEWTIGWMNRQLLHKAQTACLPCVKSLSDAGLNIRLENLQSQAFVNGVQGMWLPWSQCREVILGYPHRSDHSQCHWETEPKLLVGWWQHRDLGARLEALLTDIGQPFPQYSKEQVSKYFNNNSSDESWLAVNIISPSPTIGIRKIDRIQHGPQISILWNGPGCLRHGRSEWVKDAEDALLLAMRK